MEIISREAWGARPPEDPPVTVAMSRRTAFTTHYSGAVKTQTVRAIQDFHMRTRGWSDIGYNFLVDYLGRIYEGRGWTAVGAHAKGHNTESIGVCFIGKDGDATPPAKRAIRWLADEANRRAGKTLRRNGHRDVGVTSCPGNDLYAWVRAGMPVTSPAPTPRPPSSPAGLVVDGKLGPATIRRWQQIMGTPADGEIDVPSALVRAVQRHLNAHGASPRLVVDGVGIAQDGREYRTVRALQRYLSTQADGKLSAPVSEAVRALQRRLNGGKF